ncbi:MAG: flagellar basal body rod protein FlgC [Alphaproteobacteria bacterium]|nr:flagellar basal body rod protein FlgC [Alphaproteobacteria bacterium]
MATSSSGLETQSKRMRVTAENIANAESLPDAPGKDPYRRKLIFFKNQHDRTTGKDTVRVKSIKDDPSEFPLKYDPTHPAADADGYVKTPNLDPTIEQMDAREAQRSYEANLNLMDMTKGMAQRTIDVLR